MKFRADSGNTAARRFPFFGFGLERCPVGRRPRAPRRHGAENVNEQRRRPSGYRKNRFLPACRSNHPIQFPSACDPRVRRMPPNKNGRPSTSCVDSSLFSEKDEFVRQGQPGRAAAIAGGAMATRVALQYGGTLRWSVETGKRADVSCGAILFPRLLKMHGTRREPFLFVSGC